MNTPLLKEITILVNEQVITPDTAEKIRAYYQLKDEKTPNRSGIVLGILGSLLIGGGIILILAHNWDDFNRATKTTFSFLPLLVAQCICVYTLFRQKQSIAWRESSASLLFFAVGACISLISQVYQVSGTLSGFLLTWTLLCLPLIYILSSSTVALLIIASVTWWASLQGYFERPASAPYLYLPLMAVLIPHYISVYRKYPSGNFLFLMNCFIAVSILIVTAAFLQFDDDWYPWIFAFYLLLLCIYYNIGHLNTVQDHPAVWKPFYFSGVTGILVILFIWSFEWLWQDGQRGSITRFYDNPLPYLIFAFLIVFFSLARKKYLSKQDWTDHPLGVSIIVFIPALFFFYWWPAFGTLMINAWLLTLGLLYIRKGGRQNHFGILNFGLVIIGVLAICRFFDESIPFTWRGSFFLVTGTGFFLGNYMLIRKRKQLKQTITP